MDARSRRDNKKWRRFLLERLSPDERKALEDSWHRSNERRRVMREDLGPRDRELAKRAWISYVLDLQVDLKPGLAVIREPGSAPGSRVEFRWVMTTGVRPMGQQVRSPEIAEIRVVFGSPGYGMDPDLADYRAALSVRFSRSVPEAFKKDIPSWWPAPGQDAKIPFYEWLLATYDALATEGHRAPAVELARRLDKKHATVKTWLRRGRQYLREER